MVLNKLPKVGEGMMINGKLYRISEVVLCVEPGKALITVDAIGKYESPEKRIEVDFKWADQ